MKSLFNINDTRITMALLRQFKAKMTIQEESFLNPKGHSSEYLSSEAIREVRSAQMIGTD